MSNQSKDADAVHDLKALMIRIADSLERLAPPRAQDVALDTAEAFVWSTDPDRLNPVADVNRIDLGLLRGINKVRDLLLENTRQFARGFAANNALLWGARGMGKSSLIKAAHAEVSSPETPLKLIEIHREDIASLPRLMELLRDQPQRVILFCDDLSFDADDASYKSLKAALEGGLEGRPRNVLFYATSNRRHLLPRDMMENEQSRGIHPGEAVEEKVSLSDRFGLWLGVHNCSQEEYLEMVDAYVRHYQLEGQVGDIHGAALSWSVTRGARSGRVAWQFIQDFAGRQGRALRPRNEAKQPSASADSPQD